MCPNIDNLVISFIIGNESHVIVRHHLLNLIISFLQQVLLVLRNDNVSQIERQTSFKSLTITQILNIIQEFSRHVHTATFEHVTDNVTQSFLRDQRIDIRIVFRGKLIQDHTSHGRFDHMSERLTVFIHVIDLHLDFSMQVDSFLVESDNYLLRRIELQTFTPHALSRFRDIV